MSLALPSFIPPSSPPLAEQLLGFRRRWRLILAIALIIPLGASAELLRMPVTYTATGTMLYDPENAGIPGDVSAPPQDAANEDAVTASQSAVIASLPAAREIAAELGLAANPKFRHGAGPDALAEAVRHALNVSVLPGSRVLEISFTCVDGALSARVVNAAMALYIQHERDETFAALTDAQAWLETHAAQTQAQLDHTETELARATAAAGVVQGAQASLTDETLSRLAASLVQAQADLAMNQARLNAGQADAAAANAAIAPNLLPLRKEQADLQAEVQALSGEFGPQYPDLAAARRQLGAITGEINAESAREMNAARAEAAADEAEITTLSNALSAARAESQSEDRESAPVRALEQRAEASRAMLRAMTLQAGALAQDASLTRPDARILSLAEPPASPSTPHRSLIALAALALGLCLGLLTAGLAEALDTSLRSGEMLRSGLGLNCLALVPETASPYIAVLEAPFSLYAEQLRAIRTGLNLQPGQGRIIAITAARPGEGKTTLTIALARALSAAGLRTLAIDGDIRQPSFDPIFLAGGAPGLTDHLAGLTGLDEIILDDPLSPLQIIPAGTQAKAALSLFLSPRLGECFAQLRASYDVILLDVPPAFALAEGRVLASLADAALLCIRWGKTPQRVARGAMTVLREAGVTLAGAVLTRVNPKTHGRSGFADAEAYQPRYGGYFR